MGIIRPGQHAWAPVSLRPYGSAGKVRLSGRGGERGGAPVLDWGVGEDEVDRLIHLFAVKISGVHDVLEVRPAHGLVVVRQDTAVHRLHLDRDRLARLLAEGADRDFWGPCVDAVESAARFMSIHLDESLATREAHATGCWTHVDGGFDPRPPWLRGAHAQE